MNTKKLLGTVIGVSAFAALIAGATFAWLTFAANVTNGNYAGSTLGFNYTYDNGTTVSSIKMLNATPDKGNIPSGSGYVSISAEKPTGNAKASSFQLYLKSTANSITATGVFKYAVCRTTSASDSACNNSAGSNIPATVSDKWVAVGTISPSESGSATGKLLYNDTASFNTLDAVTEYYHVFFWINGDAITPDNQNSVVGKTFTGYVYANSTQTD